MMTKIPLPLRVDDVSIFTRALSRQLGAGSPSHLTLMNMVARAAGFGNLQHMRAARAATRRMQSRDEDILPEARSVERALRKFDAAGRLLQWPSRRPVQNLALWALWAVVPANTILDEPAINDILANEHCFEDPATLRRTMISCGLLTRRRDGSQYRRIEQEPPAEAKAVIRELSARRRSRAAYVAQTQDA